MELLKKIVDKLNIDINLQNLIFKRVAIPYHDDYNSVNQYWYEHPPCLIPLFLGYGASYKGIINHFFINRKNTFVELDLEYGSIVETAFNFKQLSVYLILPMIMSYEGLTEEIIEFAGKIDFDKCQELDDFSNKYGDNTDYFDELVYFKNNLPLNIIKDMSTYKGDFPSSYDNLNESQVINSCLFEISPAAYETIKNRVDIPEWLIKETDKKQLFENYILNNQLKEAWLTLNSKGWLLKDVAEGLETLKSKTNDELFHLVADNWIAGWRNSTFLNGNY
ncbi:hypothetical protein BBI01_01320 [Chryseobacterium artocarpi]|uniref:Uncharacterized protein n=1 Tax=Chryseobacterium artocarpi TaxID=1414727 RepID=A0A1B8ZZV5_9FLAO|nr:hypothetical protein [Chryseobacterium artocarpi]OCA77131.1 hypothetical protein BBI01_01320 [Chryseobacterium artocarpi]